MEQEKLLSKEELQSYGLIHPAMEDLDVVNAFRNLRTSLLNKMEQYNSTLMVTAITPDGGASFVATNLAAAFTFDHQKTAMLIDCNFQDPALAEKFNLDFKYGLKDFISGKVNDISQIVYSTGIQRLRLIPSGNQESDVVEFFTGERMFSFLSEVRSRYSNRIIIIDAPPILDSADTKILAELADYILLVVPYKGVTTNLINRTLNSIDKTKIVGMILNK
ncbi:MAG: AAA family ATPase [Pseudomonadota bacterium]